MSTTPQLFPLLRLVLAWQAHLKSQIEVFITTVFLRVLESENSTFEHKRQVLDVVTAFSDTPQALVEIFLTYDCDLHAVDLYNRIVHALSKVWELLSCPAFRWLRPCRHLSTAFRFYVDTLDRF